MGVVSLRDHQYETIPQALILSPHVARFMAPRLKSLLKRRHAGPDSGLT